VTPKPKRIGRPPREKPAERLVVYLAVPLKRRLEHRAVDERRPVTALVADAVADYLRRKAAPRS
jgi:hypothetical protein